MKLRRRRDRVRLNVHDRAAASTGDPHRVRALQAQRRRLLLDREAVRQVFDFMRAHSHAAMHADT